VIWGGGNDVLAAVGEPDALSKVNAAAASLKSVLAELIAHGASDLLVPNLPDVSLTPEVQAHGPKVVQEARSLTEAFNKAVEQGVCDLLHSSSSVQAYRLDVAAMAERARKDPASFGFTNITTPCRGSVQCGTYLFWDIPVLGRHSPHHQCPCTFGRSSFASTLAPAGRIRPGISLS
jgi:outer membrane lipase/esterase